MADTSEHLSIGAFARSVGLTPSALRYYDDCDVLRPARVDPATGYRFYHPDQRQRALLLRKLRTAGLPLAEVLVVLDGGEDDARRVLSDRLTTLRDEAEAARTVVGEVLSTLGRSERPEAVLGGAELAAAIRQVAPAAAVRPGYESLGCVLVEVGGDEARFVATDRYRLAMRVLHPLRTGGTAARLPIPVDRLRALTGWMVRQRELTLGIEGAEAVLHGESDQRRLAGSGAAFPDYRAVLAGLAPARHRVVVDRRALLAALADAGTETVELRLGDDELELLHAGATRTLNAVCTAAPLRIAFDPAVLGPALEAGVGPDALLELDQADLPAVLRCADQGSFTTLVMPVALPA
jgi:DNA-binding transcriptional MerR regulator